MRNFLKILFSKGSPAKTVSARYDAAAHSPQAARKWSGADFMLPNDLLNRETRRTIKSRARYECENCPWLQGMILQVANDIVGTGPRLQIPDEPELEVLWEEWAKAVDLGELLRVACATRERDGEAFVQMTTNRSLAHPVKLYPILIDCDRVQSGELADESNADGIRIDRYLQPVSYSVAKSLTNPDGFYVVRADLMIHLFRKDFPEQFRGVSDIAPALPSIAMLRSYSIAMLNKMEASATVVGVLEPDVSVIDPDSVADPPFSTFDMPSRSWMTLPSGYKSKQFQCLNPVDSQNAYAEQVKTEVARCLLATKNVVLGDSSSYNYSSARLDMQSYDRAIEIERQRLEGSALEKIFMNWLREAFPNRPMPRHFWYWQNRGYVSPLQEANAEQVRLQNGTATFQGLCEERGQDWENVLRQRFEYEAKKRSLEKEYGFSLTPSDGTAPTSEDDADSEDNRNRQERQ